MKRIKTSRWAKGATMVEYGLMVALIALVVAIAVSVLGNSLDTIFQNVIAVLFGG
jgi:pilus assembly protein Flp/PilA